MSCLDGKGPRSFCGKYECKYHFDKSFASFQGMCCGASDSKECEENGCYCGKKKVDCWDQQKNGDITPYMVSKGSEKKYNFICCLCNHSFQMGIDKITTRLQFCPPCGKKKAIIIRTKTKSQFIQEAKEVHESYYDYSKVEYKGCYEKCIITCPIHGEFIQKPCAHLQGQGCWDCRNIKIGNAKRYTTQEFIMKAIEKHGDRYDYSKVEYVGNSNSIDIICEEHGIFSQTPHEHLDGSGCPYCGRERTRLARLITPEEFLQKAYSKHEGVYTYSITEYKNVKTSINITCSIHGIFPQRPANHLQGQGCPMCANIKNGELHRLTNEEFISKAKEVHNDKYDYFMIDYKGTDIKVKIICSLHGTFTQTPHGHLSGQGCSKCSGRSSKPAIEWLHMIQSRLSNPLQTNDSLEGEYRIPNTRFDADGYDSFTNTIYEFHGDYYHGNPVVFQYDVFNQLCHKTMGELYQKTLEKKQICIEAGYKYVEIWERQHQS